MQDGWVPERHSTVTVVKRIWMLLRRPDMHSNDWWDADQGDDDSPVEDDSEEEP